MMKTGIRMCLILMALMCLLCASAAAAVKSPSKIQPSAPEQTQPPAQTLILQTGNTTALLGDTTVSVPAPRYAANGAIQIPLRTVCDAFGLALTWDAQRNEASVGDGALVFATDSWYCTVRGERVVLPTPVQNVGGTLYVPLLALAQLEGFFTHSFGFYEGGWLVISNHPMTQGDRGEHPNEPYAADEPDEALTACAQTALAALGPNAGLFDKTAIILRCGSRFAYVGEEQQTLCDIGGGVMPQLNADGTLQLPVQQLAGLCGWQSAVAESGSVTLSRDNRQVVLDRQNLTLTPAGSEDAVKLSMLDGTLYCSAQNFTEVFGGYLVFNRDTQLALITPWNVTEHTDLHARAWAKGMTLTLQRFDGAKGLIALTFDDGPTGKLTPRLLDGLKARGAHATFFLCDYRIRTFPDFMERYIGEGHELGNHSANHATLTTSSAATLASELDGPNESIQRLAGVNPVLMRPPGGAYNKTVLDAAAARGMSCIMWSLDTLDWQNRNADAIVKKVLNSVQDGDIVLMHDLYSSTVDAALRIIDALQARGYVFVTVSELAEAKGIDLAAGGVYTKLR